MVHSLRFDSNPHRNLERKVRFRLSVLEQKDIPYLGVTAGMNLYLMVPGS